MSFINQYPVWYYVLCLVLGAGLSFFLYYKDKRLSDFSKPLVYTLQIFRFLSITLIALLLIAPLLRYTKSEKDEPIFVVLTDDSQSMQIGQDSASLVDQIKLQNEAIASSLSEKGRVEFLSFGEKIKDSASFSFNDRITDFQSIFDELELRYMNRNLAAIVLSSDGIYNQGLDPRYVNLPSAPIFAIAYGDTTPKKDLILDRILNNNIAFLGNDFPIEVQIRNTLNSDASTEVQIYQSNELVASESIQISNSQSFIKVPFTLNANELGVQKYSVVLKTVEGEYTRENNAKEFYIDILDGRQKVLIVSNAPHPDVAAIKSAILEQENFEVSVKSLNDEIGIEPYDLIILHDIPNRDLSSRQFVYELMEANKSVLFVFGEASDPEALKRFFAEAQFISTSSSSNEATSILNKDFPLFQLSEKNADIVKEFPPLLVKGGYFKNSSKSLTAYFQKIGTVQTDFPLIDFWDRQTQKIGFVYGEGLWRWKFANYRQSRNHDAFNEIVNKSVQYLSLKADKSFFRVNQEPAFFENEAIQIFAQLYNESYELINEPDVRIEIKNEEGLSYDYAMSQSESAYFLKIGELPVGSYSYQARVSWGGKDYQDEGQFSVKSIQFEQLNTVANHQVMAYLSHDSGGDLFYPNQTDQLVDQLSQMDAPTKLYETEQFESFINMKWLFFLILFLVTMEWFIRKRQGAY